jgi:flagellar biosynthesis/type III secretory pathway protein FliH
MLPVTGGMALRNLGWDARIQNVMDMRYCREMWLKHLKQKRREYMAKKGRKKITNPTDHTLYIRGYRAGLKAGYKKGLQAPGVVEQAMQDMFQLFKGNKA